MSSVYSRRLQRLALSLYIAIIITLLESTGAQKVPKLIPRKNPKNHPSENDDSEVGINDDDDDDNYNDEGDDDEGDDHDDSNDVTSVQQECTILVRMDLRFDGKNEPAFECKFESPLLSSDGVDGPPLYYDDFESPYQFSVPMDLTDEQHNQLKKQFLNGSLVSNESKVTFNLNQGLVLHDDTVIQMPRHQPLNIANKPNRSRDRLRERHLATTTGEKSILVVKVKDSHNKARDETTSEISDDIFGTFGDSVTLKSQIHDCSFGRLEVVPGIIAGKQSINELSPGVVEVKLNIPLEGSSRSKVRNAVSRAVEFFYDITLPGPYDHVMYVLEGCYNTDCGWAAYAFINSWLTVYQGDYYKYVGVQMHGKLLHVLDSLIFAISPIVLICHRY